MYLQSCLLFLSSSLLVPGNLLEGYDELGNRYQLPIYCISAPINLIEGSESDTQSPDSESAIQSAAANFAGEELQVKFRLSSLQNDVKMPVYSKETIFSAKRKLGALQGFEPREMRWYFGGRLLNDKIKIEELKLQNGFVVQVVVPPADD